MPASWPFRPIRRGGTATCSGSRRSADDAQAKIALTEHDVLDRIEDLLEEAPHLKKLNWLATDRISDSDAQGWNPPLIHPESLAMLQYTSGSTGTPKGVMLSHANLMHNVQLICYSFELHRNGSGLSWLPTYHDMGLVGGVLSADVHRPPRGADVAHGVFAEADPLAAGHHEIWRHDQRRAELCLRAVYAQGSPTTSLKGLDLSKWEVAFNGAEPVRADTLERVQRAVRPLRLSARSVLSLLRHGRDDADRHRQLQGPAARRSARSTAASWTTQVVPVRLPACRRPGPGRLWPCAADEEVRIVDPETRASCRRSDRRNLGQQPQRRPRLLEQARGDRRDVPRALLRAPTKARSCGRATSASARRSCSSPAG
jgi:acyl-CoA synthetase (AMP-forming)/AMP-acid ligase II